MNIKFKLLFLACIFHFVVVEGQTIKRINGSAISVDSLTGKIDYLMRAANVSGIADFRVQ
jgi:hypothetical protein